jgi:purine-binding chemotaxis protein CheW
MQFCTFTVADLAFAVPVADVQEVIRHQVLTPVPLAPAEIGGLINLRGQIITAIDLRRRLQLPPREAGHHAMNVMLKTADGIVSLLVDRIEDVIEVADATLEQPPATLVHAARELISAASKQPGRLLLILDTAKATALAA